MQNYTVEDLLPLLANSRYSRHYNPKFEVADNNVKMGTQLINNAVSSNGSPFANLIQGGLGGYMFSKGQGQYQDNMAQDNSLLMYLAKLQQDEQERIQRENQMLSRKNESLLARNNRVMARQQRAPQQARPMQAQPQAQQQTLVRPTPQTTFTGKLQ